MSEMFDNCRNLKRLDLSNFDTSKVTNMQGMFVGCRNLTSLDLGNFDTSKVTNMSDMFGGCKNLTSLDLGNFDTSKVTDMQGMFASCENLTRLDLSNFDTSKVTDMSDMFYICKNLTSLDLGNFDTSNVTNMSGMFIYCTNLTNLDVSNFDTSKVTDMLGMFNYCTNLTSLDLGNFDTSNVTDMQGMFANCRKLTSLDLGNFDTSNVTYMSGMFYGCENLTSLDLSSFDTSNVTDMQGMFADCKNLTTIYASDTFKTSNVNNFNKEFPDRKPLPMFYECTSLVGEQGTKYNESHNDLEYAHIDEGTSNPGYFTYKEYKTHDGEIYISKAYIDSKSDSASEISKFKYSGLNFNLDIKFVNLNDYITYKLIITNDTDSDYWIQSIDDGKINENITYSITTEGNDDLIASKTNRVAYVTVKYANQLSNESIINGFVATNNLKIILADHKPEKSISENPKTGLKNYLIFLLVILLGICLYFLIRKKYKILGIIAICLMLSSTIVYALTCEVNINARVQIRGYDVDYLFLDYILIPTSELNNYNISNAEYCTNVNIDNNNYKYCNYAIKKTQSCPENSTCPVKSSEVEYLDEDKCTRNGDGSLTCSSDAIRKYTQNGWFMDDYYTKLFGYNYNVSSITNIQNIVFDYRDEEPSGVELNNNSTFTMPGHNVLLVDEGLNHVCEEEP